MAPAEEDAALTAASASRGRRRGRRRSLSWGTVFYFASRREGGKDQEVLPAEGTPWERSRRRKRTVPVDGDLVATTADPEVMMSRGTDDRGLRFQGCCFLPPTRTPGRKQHGQQNRASLSQHSTMESNAHIKQQRHVERTEQPPPPSQSHKNPPSEATAPSQIQATDGSTGSRRSRRAAEQPRGVPAETRAPTRAPTTKACGSARPSKSEATAREPCTRTKASAGRAGVGAFGPVVGLSVVAAVSMAGLLGGRLWAVACVCAWLAALSRLRQREPPAAGYGAARGDGGQEVAIDVDSTDYKKLVVLRGLLERDRKKDVAA